MVSRAMKSFTALMVAAAGVAFASEDVQWVRVTALLEPAPGATVRVEQTMVPGGVYSLAEVDRRGMDAIDKEIMNRTKFLGVEGLEYNTIEDLAEAIGRPMESLCVDCALKPEAETSG